MSVGSEQDACDSDFMMMTAGNSEAVVTISHTKGHEVKGKQMKVNYLGASCS